MRPRPVQLMDYREYPVLYVDDEPENLRVFELTFRRDYTIFTASSASEGLRILNENPIAVILSDHRMPQMTGTEFLARAGEIDAKPIRMLVTAYGSTETLGEAINSGSVSRYIPKPWQPDEMRTILREAIDSYALDRERDALLSELTLINRLSRSLHRELDLDRLVALVLDAAHRELGFDGAALLLFDGEHDQLAWRGLAPDGDEVASRLRGITLSSDTSPDFVGRVLNREAQSLRVDHLSELEGAARKWAMEVAADEILVVPLVGHSEVIGALAVDNRSGGRRFGAEDRTLLEGLAIQVVIAIENARVVEDLRGSREQVMRGDRLGTLGTLAAGLAHEINNPLVSINTFLTLAPDKRGDDDPEFWKSYHTLACGELERIRGLVASMSRLGRGGPGAGNPEQVDLGDLAGEVVQLLQREASAAGVVLELDVDPRTSTVLAVRAQLHQVLMNLLLNATHASAPDGTVTVRVEPNTDRHEGGVHIRVEDSGAGIPDEHLDQIFDPFFTTKGPDQGTGLGLMISHQIVADHGGEIAVRSRAGEGACFTVRLPLKPPA